jgi:hypothetical protein
MPFTFKLSVRLALSFAVVCVACELPGKRVTDPDLPTVAQVVMSPSTVTLDPYQSRQFLAFGRTQTGDSIPVQVGWSATGGTVTPVGLYTAGPTAGAYHLIATVTTGSLADTAAITIAAATATTAAATATAAAAAAASDTSWRADSGGV